MLSEWLVDVPPDLHDNWYFVVCPIAKRCLVVAARGVTTAYSRTGHYISSFPSHIPGGCRKSGPKSSEYSILDCFYDSQSSTYYILDLMCWKGHPIYDSETEFRFYWLESKLRECDFDLSRQSRTNPYKFVSLKRHDCSPESITRIVSLPSPHPVDGFLFFHKRATYYLGRTPLALWLKPHMISEVLGISVSQEFLECCPVIDSRSKKMETEGGGGGGGGKMEIEREGRGKIEKGERKMRMEEGRRAEGDCSRMEGMMNES